MRKDDRIPAQACCSSGAARSPMRTRCRQGLGIRSSGRPAVGSSRTRPWWGMGLGMARPGGVLRGQEKSHGVPWTRGDSVRGPPDRSVETIPV